MYVGIFGNWLISIKWKVRMKTTRNCVYRISTYLIFGHYKIKLFCDLTNQYDSANKMALQPYPVCLVCFYISWICARVVFLHGRISLFYRKSQNYKSKSVMQHLSLFSSSPNLQNIIGDTFAYNQRINFKHFG